MKIKFLKPFRLYNPIGDDLMMNEGTVENMEKEDYAKWLIDTGFAKEVQESGWWKPQSNEKYYYLAASGEVYIDSWVDGGLDELRYSMGECFKTEKAAEAWRDYLKAVTTVRQDEGVLTPEQAKKKGYIYCIYIHNDGLVHNEGLVVHGFNADYVSVNTVLFDTREHAQASRDKHRDEWKIIANYDWSRERRSLDL